MSAVVAYPTMPESKFSDHDLTTTLKAFVHRVKESHFTGASLSTKVKYLQDRDTGASLVTVFVDGSKELYAMVNTPDMSVSDKDAEMENYSSMFNSNILLVLRALKEISDDLAVYGWQIDSVYPLIRNVFGFGGMNHKTNTPIHGVADFRFVFFLSPHLSANKGADGLRVTPLCNNTAREGTPMLVNSLDAPEFTVKRRQKGNVDEDAPEVKFTTPEATSFDALTAPNPDYVKKCVKMMTDHVIGGGAFASRALKWMQSSSDPETCLTRIKYDYSKIVDLEVRENLPSQFFRISHDHKTGDTTLPSASAQQVVLKFVCEESLRFLANWPAFLTEVADAMRDGAPTIGWRAVALTPLVRDKDRYVGKSAEKGGSCAMIVIPLTPHLVGAWEGKRPLCSNTAEEGFPMLIDTTRTAAARPAAPRPAAPRPEAPRPAAPRPSVSSTYASRLSADAGGGSRAGGGSPAGGGARRPVTGAPVGRR